MRFLLFLILCPILLLASDNALASGENYIVRRDYLNAAGTEYVDVVEYFDGLGRSVETVQRGITPSGQSLVTVREYDSQSRLAREWQPVVSPNTDFTDPSEVSALANATYGHANAYTSTEYHRSPIEEVYAVTRPSNQQFGKAVTKERFVNDPTSQLKCYDFRVRDNTLTNYRLFPTGSLKATKMTDEDGHVSIEFRDRKKRLRVQRLAVSDGNYADTYYVYDNYDELRYVIPPTASEQLAGPLSVGKEWTVSDKEISDWCYYYEYDIFGHVTVKKFPGSEKTVYRYNGNNRLTFSQNGEQRKSGSWTFYFYDHLVRLVLSGEISCMPSEAEDLLKESHVAEYAGGENSPTMGYRIGTQALAEDYFSPDVAYFYDNYDFLPSVGGVERFAYREGLSDPRHHSAMGMQTGKCVSGDVTVSYYDGEGRVVQSHTSHGTDGMTSRYNKYTFTGQPLETLILHAGKSGSIREHYRYAYDSKGRQTDIWHSLNGGSEVRLCHTDYDELLRPKTIYSGAVPTEYTYDEEGRVVTATSPTFSMAAGYAEGGNYNGNISSETWDNGGEQRKYTYRYDGMNRLVSAKYDGTGKYGTEYRYDKNSNPTHIKRQGFMYSYNGNPLYGDIDDLTISYTGNHIKQVSDANNGLCHYGGLDFSKIAYGSDGDYRYNANGSLSYDPDRGISICYDRHNLPQLIKFDRGGEITYRNDGEGRRMEVTHRISSASASLAGKPVPTAAYKTVLKRKYIDHFVYRNDTLEYILTPTGYIDRDGNYYHYQKDSRGSVRTVLDGAGRVVERNDYYPYGMLMDGVSKSVQPYKFGGKELDRIGGINHYDFHARQLQLPIPHFYQQDPYADKYPHLSPYLYCAANPLRYVDPSGKWLESAWDIFNISLGAKSLSDNISQGKYGEAAIDALGMAGDMIALAFPAVPGGFGTGIKASRVGENVIDTGIKTVKANKSNYRKALQQATGKEGNGFEAHHTLPQKHRPDFEKLGINIDEPGHVVWREAKNHRQNSWKFTKEWDKFFDTNKSYTKEDIINFRNEKEKEIFGNYTGDTPEN